MSQLPISVPDEGTVLWKAVTKVTECCALERRDLEAILGLSQATLSRLYQKNGPLNLNSKEAEIALLLVRLYESLAANVGGDDQAARVWLRSHNQYFNTTPLQHMQTITGLVDVLAYLDSMRGKS